VWTLAVLLAAAGCAASSEGGPPTGEHAGFSPGSGLTTADPVRLAAELDAIRASGARWVRVDVDWSGAEPSPGRYDFSTVDRVVEAAASRDLEVLGLLSYTPAWARPLGTDQFRPPTDPAAMARFATVAGHRWGSRVAAWEVWNEPNLGDYWSPRADPAAYTRLLTTVAPALRAADPGTPVLSGGLAPAVTGDRDVDPVTFLDGIYVADGADALDAVAVHPYSYPARPDDLTTAGWNSFVRLPLIHAVMSENGDDDKKVWITEYGAPTGTSEQAVSPERQAELIANGIARARRLPWVATVLVYSLRDTGTDASDREQNFGVLRDDGSPKPAWDTVRREFARAWRSE
jgi:hypothetical protein